MGVSALIQFAPLVGIALVAACSGVQQTRVGVLAPREDTFPPVADYLDHRCGTLDCHGQPGRNLRIWGCEGMRLNPKDISSCISGAPTTPDEWEATYRSLIGLEPAVMSAVVSAAVQGKEVHPELLTFVRKARGTENHKGGQLIQEGDDQDTCIVSWLRGNTDPAACGCALNNYPKFPETPTDAGAIGATPGSCRSTQSDASTE
jgi:hypothetical protein